MEELRGLPLKGVADELERPPDDEQAQGHGPESVHEEGDDEERD